VKKTKEGEEKTKINTSSGKEKPPKKSGDTEDPKVKEFRELLKEQQKRNELQEAELKKLKKAMAKEVAKLSEKKKTFEDLQILLNEERGTTERLKNEAEKKEKLSNELAEQAGVLAAKLAKSKADHLDSEARLQQQAKELEKAKKDANVFQAQLEEMRGKVHNLARSKCCEVTY
jgi:hypothetical protein